MRTGVTGSSPSPNTRTPSRYRILKSRKNRVRAPSAIFIIRFSFLFPQVLRALNNNPSVFGKASRPIVEFSVENRKALNAR